MATTMIACNRDLKKLVKLRKGLDMHYPDSVTEALRKEYRDAIRPFYGDDYMLEEVQAAVESGHASLIDLRKVGDEVMIRQELRAIHYLNLIHEELHRKWREMNEMVVGHCGTPCNLGCPECAPGGYDHAGEV
jgi:hypothetical protein